MSYLMNKYDEVTVILLASKFESDLPKLGQLKKLLGTSEVLHYKSGGYYSDDVDKLSKAISYSLNTLFPLERFGPRSVYCSDLLLTKVGSCRGTFLKISHPELLVDGFDLTKQNFNDLTLHLKKIEAAKEVHFSYKSWCHNVSRNIEKFNELGIYDPSVINFDVANVEQQMSSYAIQAITDSHNEITQWVTQNRWK